MEHRMSTRDALDASAIAHGAGHLLLEIRERTDDPAERKTAGDAESQRYLAEKLSQQFPDDAVLSEEAPDSIERLGARRVWIIDPLDGTREFSEPRRDDWAVHVALVQDGELVAGAVALPAMGLTLSSAGPLPALRPIGLVPRIAVSRTRPAVEALAVAKSLNAQLVPMGSAGAKAMAVVRGTADVYLHSGGQWEWDSAAPVAVAAAAGLHVSRLDGSPLRYNQPDPWLPDLLVCHRSLAERVIQSCRATT
jgi:3'(2'), 5'-bisphosphate nucleotidase